MGVTFWIQTNVGDDIHPYGRDLTDFKAFCELVGANIPQHEPVGALRELAAQEGLPLEPLLRVTGLPVELAELPEGMPIEEQEDIGAEIAAHNAWAETCWQEIGEFRTVLRQWAAVPVESTLTAPPYDHTDPGVVRWIMRSAVESLLVLVDLAAEGGATQVRMCAEW